MTTNSHHAAIYRNNKAARSLRDDFPVGSWVRTKRGGRLGEVTKVIPSMNAQGGSLKVRWANGVEGRISPISVEKHEPEG